MSGPKNIAAGPGTDIYVADTENNAIRRLDVSHGTIELITGTGTSGTAVSCDPLQTQLARPHGIWVDPDGGIFVSDTDNHRILYIAPARLAAGKGCR